MCWKERVVKRRRKWSARTKGTTCCVQLVRMHCISGKDMPNTEYHKRTRSTYSVEQVFELTALVLSAFELRDNKVEKSTGEV